MPGKEVLTVTRKIVRKVTWEVVRTDPGAEGLRGAARYGRKVLRKVQGVVRLIARTFTVRSLRPLL
jgi:hypothetical protein